MPDGTPHPAFRHPAAMPGDGASGTLTDAACGRSAAPPWVTPSAGPPRATPPTTSSGATAATSPGSSPPFNEDWRDARPIAPYHKGDGHVTDDTLLTLALVDVYAEVRGHLDAYAIAAHLVPRLIGARQWIPELEAEALLVQRLFLAEKWLVARLHYGHVDPREAGVGNIVNCGAAMYMAPVGIVNAGDPAGAYAEAIDMTGAHQSSYGREAAGVFAAAVAEAMRPGASISTVVDAAVGLAKDGTRQAIEAVADAAARHDEWASALGAAPRCGRPVRHRRARLPVTGARRPPPESYQGDRGAAGRARPAARHRRRLPRVRARRVNYGRDADSIATMAGAVTGALGGMAAVPERWRTTVVGGEPHRHRRAGAHDGRGRPRGLGRRRSRRHRPRCGAIVAARRSMIRLSWSQPEDLLPHALVAAELDGVEVGDLRERWIAAGGRAEARAWRGVVRQPPRPSCASWRLDCWPLVDEREVPAELRRREPDDLAAIDARSAPGLSPVSSEAVARPAPRRLARPGRRVPARQAGGEGPPTRHPGDRRARRATGRSPRTSPPSASTRRSPRRYPWNRRSATNSLVENIDGMPEDDDLNFPLIALDLVERRGEAITTDDVAHVVARAASRRPGVHRRAGDLPQPPRRRRARVAGRRGNPFQDWIGAQIRADVYGWVTPGRPGRAARLAWTDARLTHHRSGLYGAMFVAAAASAAVVAAIGGRVHRRRPLGRASGEPLCRSRPRRRGPRTRVARPRGGARRAVRRVRPPALGARAQQRRTRGVRAGAQRRRVPPGDHHGGHRRLGHRLQRGHGRLDLRCPRRGRRACRPRGRRRCATG